MADLPRVPWRDSLRYELVMWRGLFRCLAAGHHTMSRANGYEYCWTCFHRYRWDGPMLMHRFRNLLGYLVSSDTHYWR